MKKFFSIFALLIAFISACYGFEPRKRHALEDIFAIPTVKELSDYYEEHDFSYTYTVYLTMQNGMKIILTGCKYENGKLTYQRIRRFGDYAILRYSYTPERNEKNLNFYIPYNSSDIEKLLPEIKEYTGDKSIETILLNYKEIDNILKKLPIVDSSIRGYKNEEKYFPKKTDEEYCEMLKSEYCYFSDDGYLCGVFRLNADDYFFSEFSRGERPWIK